MILGSTHVPIRMQYGSKYMVVGFSEERKYCCLVRAQLCGASEQTHFVSLFGLIWFTFFMNFF